MVQITLQDPAARKVSWISGLRKCEESSILRVSLVEGMYLFSRVCAYIHFY